MDALLSNSDKSSMVDLARRDGIARKGDLSCKDKSRKENQLQTEDPTRRGGRLLDDDLPRRTVDLSCLDVCFGGFTPMALSDGSASSYQVEQAQKRAAQKRAEFARAAEIEAARTSDPADYLDDSGVCWRYVVLDNKEIRIEKCLLDDSSDDLIDGGATLEIEIPSVIDGKPVVALADDSCAFLKGVTSITVPNSVSVIGKYAFRENMSLERIVFPKDMAVYDSDWVRHCINLREIVLPGQLPMLTSKIFDATSLRRLVIGSGTSEVMPGAFLNSGLDVVEVNPTNPLLKTDGKGIYRVDEVILLALAVPCESYSVEDNCVALGKKAMSSFAQLKNVNLPETLQVIGDYAFAKTSIETFVAPQDLKMIGERAFFDCVNLRSVQLNEGLLSIADNAFTNTSIESLHIPGSLKELGNPIAAKTSLTYSGAEATFTIDPSSDYFMLDEQGGLYAPQASCTSQASYASPTSCASPASCAPQTDNATTADAFPAPDANKDALILIRMMNPQITEYKVLEGCQGIADDAFAKHAALERVIFPESLKFIGKRSFKDCLKLKEAQIPSHLVEVGEEAFLDTSLSSFFVPKTLTRIGALALVSHGAHHGTAEPSLKSIEVEEGNPRYRMDGSLLLERLDNGSDRVIICTGSEPDVVIPESVKAIASYALNGLRRLRSLALSENITAIDVRGLAIDCLLESVHIDLVEPVESHAFFDICFPQTSRAAQQTMLAFSGMTFVDVRALFEHYDNSIVNASGFDSVTENSLDPYEQVRRILDRLSDPIFMSPVNRNLADKVLHSHLNDFIVEIARHDDKCEIDRLIELGYLNADNIADAIEAVGKVQDASITNHLLDAKRYLTGATTIDFEADFEL